MSPRIPRSSCLTVVALLLCACDPAPATNTPDASQQEAEAERKRQEAIEQERAKYLQNLEQAKLALEADKSFDAFGSYFNEVKAVTFINDKEVREGIDLAPHYEILLDGTGKQVLDQVLAEYANKKQRTEELLDTLHELYDKRVQLMRWQQPGSDAFKDEAIAMLALGPSEDEWVIGDANRAVDLMLLEDVEKAYGREGVHQLCRAAFDRAIADDKRDKPRQHYILQTCVLEFGDWETDLAAWAKPKETKEFRKAYGPIYAEAASDAVGIQAAREAKERGDVGSDMPTVTLINSCGSQIQLAIGDSPKSERRLSLDAETQTSEEIKANQRVYLLDASKQAIVHGTVSRYTTELEFTCDDVIYH